VLRLLDHAVGERKQFVWNRQAKRAGSSEVDDQLELRGLLHGKVAGLLTAQDAAAFAKRLHVTDAILDGEIICADGTGRPIFFEMLPGGHPVCFVAFDFLPESPNSRSTAHGRRGGGICRRCARPLLSPRVMAATGGD